MNRSLQNYIVKITKVLASFPLCGVAYADHTTKKGIFSSHLLLFNFPILRKIIGEIASKGTHFYIQKRKVVEGSLLI